MEDVRNSASAVTCLVMMARFHGLAAQPEQIKHLLGDDSQTVETIDLLRISKLLKLKAKRTEVSPEKLQDLPLPAIARDRNGQYFIIARCNEDKVLIQKTSGEQPEAGKHQGQRVARTATDYRPHRRHSTTTAGAYHWWCRTTSTGVNADSARRSKNGSRSLDTEQGYRVCA